MKAPLVTLSGPSGVGKSTLIARLLDSGAQGIILPRVEDPALLREALSWMRFPPEGKRGYGINPTMVRYETRSFPEIIEHLNRNTLGVALYRAADERLYARRVIHRQATVVPLPDPAADAIG